VGFLGVAAAFALLNWSAVERGDKKLEYIAKPATTFCLLLAALTATPDDPTQRAWFVAALAFCLAGDVFLMLPRDLFVPGLASFLVGHVAFIGGLIAHGLEYRPVAAIFFVAMGFLASPVIAAVRRSEPALLAPVVAYVVVIGAMLITALWTDSWVGALGGVMFVVSDRILAHNKFIKPFPHAQLAIMATYHAALFLLVLSLRY
jgi:uncharacterized membrane protein YhhN